MFTVDLWDSSLSPQRTRTQRSRESCHIVTNSLASSCLNTHSHTYRRTLCRSCSSGESAVLPWWWGVMSQHLPEKGAAGMLFILKNTTLAPIAVRKCKVPDISTFCSRLALHRKAPAISLHTWRIIPTETQEMCSTTEAKQEGPVPNLNPQSTHTHIHAVPTVNNDEKHFHWGTEAGSQQGVTRGREEKHSATHTHTRARMQRHKTT